MYLKQATIQWENEYKNIYLSTLQTKGGSVKEQEKIRLARLEINLCR